MQDEDDETYLKRFDNVIAGATAEDGTTIDGSESVYDEEDEEEDYSDEEDSDDYDEDEDEEDDERFGYEDDESARTSAAEFRSDISVGFSDTEEYSRAGDAVASDGNGRCKEANDVGRSHDEQHPTELTNSWS